MKGLDKYLTTAPEDCAYENWQDLVCDLYPPEFWTPNEDWIIDNNTSIEWHWRLYERGREPKAAAEIIMRAFNIYKNIVNYMKIVEAYDAEVLGTYIIKQNTDAEHFYKIKIASKTEHTITIIWIDYEFSPKTTMNITDFEYKYDIIDKVKVAQRRI